MSKITPAPTRVNRYFAVAYRLQDTLFSALGLRIVYVDDHKLTLSMGCALIEIEADGHFSMTVKADGKIKDARSAIADLQALLIDKLDELEAAADIVSHASYSA